MMVPTTQDPMIGRSTEDSPPETDYFQFDILSEPWDRFRLSDGTLLRLRFVLLKLKRAPLPPGAEPGLQSASLISQTLIVTETPDGLRGEPGIAVPQAEFRSHVEAEMTFQTEFVAPSIYRFDATRVITVNPSLVHVYRLREFAPDGDRQYFVESAASVTIVNVPPVQPIPTPPQPARGGG